MASVPDRVPTSGAPQGTDVEVPLHLDWSTSSRQVDLTEPLQRARCYEVVLREGRPEDIELLIKCFDDLVLPVEIRKAWQPLIDRARG